MVDKVELVQRRGAAEFHAGIRGRLPARTGFPGPVDPQAQRHNHVRLLDVHGEKVSPRHLRVGWNDIMGLLSDRLKTDAAIANVRCMDRDRTGSAANQESGYFLARAALNVATRQEAGCLG